MTATGAWRGGLPPDDPARRVYWVVPLAALLVLLFMLGKLIWERGFLKNGWLHVAVFILASVMAFAPTAQWAARQ